MVVARVQRTGAEADALLALRLQTVRGRLQNLGPPGGATPPALFSPTAQAQMYQLVTLVITAAATRGPGGAHALPTAVDNTFTSFGSAAVPALVWGVNFTAANTVGDC